MAIGQWTQTSGISYYAYSTLSGPPLATGGTTPTELDGTWGTESIIEAAEFNSGDDETVEEITTTVKLGSRQQENNNGGYTGSGSSMQSVFEITIMGSSSGNAGTFISEGTTHSITVAAEDSSTYATTTTKTLIFKNSSRYWYFKVKITNGGFFRPLTERNNVYGKAIIDKIIRSSYKTKTMVHGAGLQVMSGPNQYVRFGKNQNLIFGDLAVKGGTDGGGTGYFQKNLTVGDTEANTSYPLYVVGDLAATGNIIAYVSSDIRLKDHITPLENSLEKLKKLNAVDFLWKDKTKGWAMKTPQDIGLIAQEVEKVFPSLVGEMSDGYKGIRYDRLIPVLVDSIKTQDKKIDDLQALVETLVKKMQE